MPEQEDYGKAAEAAEMILPEIVESEEEEEVIAHSMNEQKLSSSCGGGWFPF